jgi:hypothetical protein
VTIESIETWVARPPAHAAAVLRRRAARELEQLEDDPDRDPDRAARLIAEYRRAARLALESEDRSAEGS